MTIDGQEVFMEALRDRMYFLADDIGLYYSDTRLLFLCPEAFSYNYSGQLVSDEIVTAFVTNINTVVPDYRRPFCEQNTRMFNKYQYDADELLRKEVVTTIAEMMVARKEHTPTECNLIHDITQYIAETGLTPNMYIIKCTAESVLKAVAARNEGK